MRALITGVTGQDGYYLSKLLNNKGYEVWGLSRQSFSLSGTHKVDLRDTDALRNCIREVQPDEVYHLGGMSSPIEGQGKPRECIETGASICTILSLCKDAKILNASSCSVFGVPYYTPQDEAHPIQPINSYGSMKAYTHFMTANEREYNNTFACNAILYHHESPHRSRNFFTQRLITSAIRISQGHDELITIYNPEGFRDIGFAGEYAEAMWEILQEDKPDDYVVATGHAVTYYELAKFILEATGLDESYIRIVNDNAPSNYLGDPTRIKKQTGWEARATVRQIIQEMTDAHINKR